MSCEAVDCANDAAEELKTNAEVRSKGAKYLIE
jgi:hypothetical protein